MVHGVAWTTIDRWGTRLLSLAVIAVLARLLNRTDFGLVAAAAVWVDYFSTFVGQGLGLAVIQRKDLEPEHINVAFWFNLVFAVILVALTWIAAPYIAKWIKYPEVRPVLRWLSIGLILEAFSRIHIAMFMRHLRFAPIAAVNIIASVAGAVAGLTLAFLGWGVWSLVAQQLVRGLSASIAVWVVTGWKPTPHFTWRHVRDLYSYSTYVFFDQQVLFMARRLDEALVAGFLGVAELGLYSIAKRMVLLLQEVLEIPLAQVFFPGFSRLQDSTEKLNRAAETSYRLVCLLVLPAFAGLIALAPEAIRLLFGPKWLDAVPLVRVLAIGAPFFLFPLTCHAVFHALGRPGVALVLNTIRAAESAILLPIGAFFGGVLGIAAALSMRNLVGAIGDIVFLRKKVPALRIRFVPGIYRPVIAAGVMVVLVRLMADRVTPWGPALGFACSVLTGIFVYSALMILMDRSVVIECFEAFRVALQPVFARLVRLGSFSVKP